MLVMGILNVTPDSFADGGKYLSPENAIARGLEMISEGVNVIDVGGESTRPGAERISLEEEQRRTLPVIEALAGKGAVISIDTMSAQTAMKAVNAGASIVNDVKYIALIMRPFRISRQNIARNSFMTFFNKSISNCTRIFASN
jgi:dihydropteroate synthase